MKLGYMDRVERTTIHVLPKRRRSNLFNESENTSDYATRFFQEIHGLGNVALVKIQHGKQHRIGLRGI